MYELETRPGTAGQRTTDTQKYMYFDCLTKNQTALVDEIIVLLKYLGNAGVFRVAEFLLTGENWRSVTNDFGTAENTCESVITIRYLITFR